MLRIPTGPVKKDTARTVSIALGVLAIMASFVPAFAPAAVLLREIGIGAAGLGTALGK